MCSLIYTNSDFQGKSKEQIMVWIEQNRESLVGSSIYTKNNSLTSKVVQWAEGWKRNSERTFTPSHTGSIVEKDEHIYVFDMKPLRAKITLLIDYLLTTKDEFVLLLREYPINTDTFNALILDRLGEWYPYMSAIRSVLTKRKSKYRQHCSEHFARTTVLSGHKFSKEFNLECTPDELLTEMLKDEN